ncbi:MAG: class II aldolase/adducin family protein [Alphaproteobacteria bacterium]|nr:class II aldolase/adducin family protein [Alphaproteobacteria bacterium]
MALRLNDPSHMADRERLAKGVRLLVREGLIPNAGHISYHPPGMDWFWTPRHVHVGLEAIGPGDFIACDMQGRAIDSPWEASGERFIYTEIFTRRPDVRVIAHFHPHMATVFSVAGRKLLPVLMLGAHIGDVPQYEKPEPVESPADGQALADALGPAKAVLMRGHGAVTVGETVEEVCALAVMLEETARVLYQASQLGEPRTIDTRGREAVFAGAFRHFQDVLWDHHNQAPVNTPFLRQGT